MPEQLKLHTFADLWHPGVFAWILLCQVAYLLAVGPWREAYKWGAPVTRSQKIWFSVGLWLIYLSEGTPLHILAETYLFSAHMIQHILLTMIMPPLILIGTPAWMIRWILRPRPIAFLFRLLVKPAPALLIFNLIYSLWHFPMAYQSTLWYHWFHMVQHAILVFTAFLMWWPVASPMVEYPRLSPLGQMFYLFVAGVSQIAVFSIITYADNVMYEFYAQAPRVWEISPHYDQQLAGAIMKVGGMLVLIIAWCFVFFNWAAREEAAMDRSGAGHSVAK